MAWYSGLARDGPPDTPNLPRVLNGAAPRGLGHDSSRGCGLRTRHRSACADLGCPTWLGAVLHHACDADSACVRMLDALEPSSIHSQHLSCYVRACVHAMQCSAWCLRCDSISLMSHVPY